MQPIICQLLRSKSLMLLMLVLYGNSAVAVYYLPCASIIKVILWFLLLANINYNFKKAVMLKHPKSIVAVWYNEQYWYVVDNRQLRFKGKLGSNSYCSGLGLILEIVNSTINKKIYLPIARDALSEAEYRHLLLGMKIDK